MKKVDWVEVFWMMPFIVLGIAGLCAVLVLMVRHVVENGWLGFFTIVLSFWLVGSIMYWTSK